MRRGYEDYTIGQKLAVLLVLVLTGYVTVSSPVLGAALIVVVIVLAEIGNSVEKVLSKLRESESL